MPKSALGTLDDLNSDLKNLTDMVDDESTLLEHLESKKKTDPQENAKLLTENESQHQPLDAPQAAPQPHDLLSKFFNSLPTGNPVSEELYYEQMNEELIKEAQKKVMLEGKLNALQLSNIEEQTEDDENAPLNVNTLHGGVLCSTSVAPLDQFDRKSVLSHAYSTASTFSPQEVKSRLVSEKKKRDTREKSKVNPKNIKGDANALRRRKQNDQALANEDLKGYQDGGIW